MLMVSILFALCLLCVFLTTNNISTRNHIVDVVETLKGCSLHEAIQKLFEEFHSATLITMAIRMKTIKKEIV